MLLVKEVDTKITNFNPLIYNDDSETLLRQRGIRIESRSSKE